MPARLQVASLRLLCLHTISSQFELVGYGCRARADMVRLLECEEESGGYSSVAGPFTCLPSSLLEDLLQVCSETRGLVKQVLHQLVLPQLQQFTINTRASRHIQTRTELAINWKYYFRAATLMRSRS